MVEKGAYYSSILEAVTNSTHSYPPRDPLALPLQRWHLWRCKFLLSLSSLLELHETDLLLLLPEIHEKVQRLKSCYPRY
jgi:hypothetical protein